MQASTQGSKKSIVQVKMREAGISCSTYRTDKNPKRLSIWTDYKLNGNGAK
jgi:hypothetical protein